MALTLPSNAHCNFGGPSMVSYRTPFLLNQDPICLTQRPRHYHLCSRGNTYFHVGIQCSNVRQNISRNFLMMRAS